jgi:putative methanogen marker protein 4
MHSSDLLDTGVADLKARIGIGAGTDGTKAERSKAEALRYGFTTISIYDDAESLALDLREGRLDAAVRGDLDSNWAMSAVRSAFGVSKVLRAAFLEPVGGRMFLLAPVGIDEGWAAEEKLELARLSVRMMRSLTSHPVVGVMAGGRSSDRGRLSHVDRSIEDAASIVEQLQREGVDARNVQILIEDATRSCDVIIAPDGISGTLIFRTLHFLGGAKALGAPVLNIERPYIDTSRAKENYADSIALAAVLASRMTGRRP